MPDLAEHVLERIRRLPGVARAEFLDRRDREALRSRATPTSADNLGVAEVLSRDFVACLFKDRTFRPPPEPTLLLVDERGQVLGREVVPEEPPPKPGERRFAFLGKDFVLFGDMNPSGRLRFLLPPVRFPELEHVAGIHRVVSASPDTPQDEFLRERLRVPKGRDLASVLVGYDVRNP